MKANLDESSAGPLERAPPRACASAVHSVARLTARVHGLRGAGTLRFAQRAKAVPVVVRPNTTVGRADVARIETDLGARRLPMSQSHPLTDYMLIAPRASRPTWVRH